jgi:vitamin B12 transporter
MVSGGNVMQQIPFSPQYTVPEPMKDDSPFLTEELERLPGVFFKESTMGGGTLDFRGLSSRHTLVFLDHIPLNDLALGEVNFSQFLSGSTVLNSLVPGANSVTYGERALGGVVLLETPFNKESNGYLQGEVGSFETAYGHGSIQDKSPHHRFIIHAEGARSSGISRHGKTRLLGEKNKYNRLGSALVFQKGTTSRHIKLTTRLTESSNKYDDNETNLPPKPQATSASKMILVGLEGRFDKDCFSHQVNIFLNKMDSEDLSSFGDFKFTTTLLGSHYEGFLPLTSKSTLRILGDIRQNQYKEGGFQKARSDWGVGLEETYTFTENFKGEVGGRFDQSPLGTFKTYSVGGIYTLNQTLLQSSFKTGFATPTFKELYFNGPFYKANPSLKPEKACTFDTSIKQFFLQNRAHLQILYFQTKVTDLIVRSSGYSKINASSKTTLSGIEILGSFSPKESLNFSSNYSFTETHSKQTSINIGFPKHKGSLGITWKFQEDWSLNNQILYIGGRQDPLARKYLDPYFSMKISLDYNLSSTSKIYMRIENLLNSICTQTYGYRSAKRTFYVGSSLYF